MILQLSEQGLSRKKKKKGLFKKIALAPVRASFLQLVAANIHSFARRLQRNIAAGKGDQIKKKWEKMGGKWSTLQKAIEKGAKKKGLFESEEQYQTSLMLAPAVAAAIGTASAAIAALAEFLKKRADDIEDIGSDAKELFDPSTPDPTDPANAGKFDTGTGKTLLIGGAALAAILLLSRSSNG